VDLRVLTVVGSVRDGRFGDRIGARVQEQLVGAGGAADVADLAELTFPHTMAGRPDVVAFRERVARADAIVVVVPEYNHSFPARSRRPSTRSVTSGGRRAVEALRLVFAELHAVTVRDAVSLHNPWGPAADPAVDHPDGAAGEALHAMARQPLRWADPLRAARHRTTCPA
jgi:NAD(P)H-dependent FMN reductase